jgi:prepilin-type N-terminal cleavage/methylation domain-containing protein
MRGKGFTLLELIVIVIIIAILATFGFTQYTKVVEKGRTAEAKAILGQIRSAETSYWQQFGSYTAVLANLNIGARSACNDRQHYFRYSLNATTAIARRCTTATSNPPIKFNVHCFLDF